MNNDTLPPHNPQDFWALVAVMIEKPDGDLVTEIRASAEYTYLFNEPPPEETEQKREHRRQQRRTHSAKYRARHPERIKMRAKNTHARQGARAGDIDFDYDDIQAQLKSQNGRCWWCGKKIKNNWHLDHRIPLARGGSNGPGNIVITHARCNLKKQDKMPWEYNGRLL